MNRIESRIDAGSTEFADNHRAYQELVTTLRERQAFAINGGRGRERSIERHLSRGKVMVRDRIDLVTVATPNATHFEITRAFLKAGFDVLCEKPMTMTVEEGEEILRLSRETGAICAVNYGYTGYALVRHMRAMVARGDLGQVRVVVAEFSHGQNGNI